MPVRATRAFHTTLPDKIIIPIIIVIIVMQLVCLCRRTPFMISSLHVTKVMMLNMIMTHEEGLWLSMQPVCFCRRTPFMISSLHMTKVMMLIMIMTHEEGLWISMQPLCLCRRTPFILTFGVHAGVSQI